VSAVRAAAAVTLAVLAFTGSSFAQGQPPAPPIRMEFDAVIRQAVEKLAKR